MPTANPKNRNVSQPFPKPAYVGARATVDRKIGQVRSPGDHPGIVLTYDRQNEILTVKSYYQRPGSSNPDVNSVTAPCFGLIWSDFRDSQGQPSWGALARNKAYARFKNKVVGVSDSKGEPTGKQQSALGVFAAERREAYGMIANRAMGLYRALRALRRGNFRQFLRELSVNPKRRHRNKLRNTADEASRLWLEYWFGWSPTVSEMYHLLDSLTKDLPANRYYGTGKQRYSTSSTFGTIVNTAECTYRVRTGATVVLTNADLFLLSQMGLANPLAVLNEVVPFSFVAEWFVQYGQCLDAMTDFVGLSLERPWSSFRIEDVIRTGKQNYPGYWSCTLQTTGPCYGMFRKTALVKPTVTTSFNTFDVFKSKTRAATAVSLLIQALLGLKR